MHLGIKVYVGRYKDIYESSGYKVIDHLSNFFFFFFFFFVTTDCERLRNLMTCYLQTLGVASGFDFLGRLADI